jgi:hypothetical protein
MDGWMDGCMYEYRWMDGCRWMQMDEWIDGWIDE